MPTEMRQVIATRLILASASPRRRELLREYGYVFRVVPPAGEETDARTLDLTPTSRAECISLEKAECAARRVNEGFVLAGDTIAALDGRVFGKPTDRDDARTILSALAGTTHQVITGVTLLDAATGRREVRHEITAVTMKPLSPEEVEAYLDTGAWEGKAGAYGIQDRGDAFVQRIEGSFTNVVGFPMELIVRMLGAWGIQPSSDSKTSRT